MLLFQAPGGVFWVKGAEMAKYLAEETRKHPAAIWLAGLISAVVTVFLLAGMLWANSGASSGMQAQAKLALMDKYNMFIANTTSEALDGIVTIEKVYFLSDEDLVAPMPDPEKYGQTQNPGDMTAVIEKAARLLDGQELISPRTLPWRRAAKSNIIWMIPFWPSPGRKRWAGRCTPSPR